MRSERIKAANEKLSKVLNLAMELGRVMYHIPYRGQFLGLYEGFTPEEKAWIGKRSFEHMRNHHMQLECSLGINIKF